MSQLYKLRSGRIGHFDELCVEETVEILSFLTILEIIDATKQFQATGTAYYINEGEKLQEAIVALKNYKDMILNDLFKVLESIAKIVYTKTHCSKDKSIELKTKRIMKDIKEKAKNRGYVEEWWRGQEKHKEVECLVS